MRRFGAVLAAVLLGFLVTWGSSYLGSHIAWPASQTSATGCYEIDHCAEPWWLVALFWIWFIGPATLFGAVAYAGFGRTWSFKRWGFVYASLTVPIVCLYFAWYVYQGFM